MDAGPFPYQEQGFSPGVSKPLLPFANHYIKVYSVNTPHELTAELPGSAMEVLRDNSERAASLLKSLANPIGCCCYVNWSKANAASPSWKCSPASASPLCRSSWACCATRSWWPPGVTANGVLPIASEDARWRFWARCTRFTAPDLNDERPVQAGGTVLNRTLVMTID